MVAQKFEILSKWTVLGSALVAFSGTKQGFTVPRGKQRCMEIGLCNICYLLYVFIVFVFTTKSILPILNDFFYSIHFEKLSLRNRWLIKKIKSIYVEVSSTTKIKREYLGPVWDKHVPDRWLCFCPQFCHFLDHLWLLLEKNTFKNLWRINCLVVILCSAAG